MVFRNSGQDTHLATVDIFLQDMLVLADLLRQICDHYICNFYSAFLN